MENWKSGNRNLFQFHKSDEGLFFSLLTSFIPWQSSIPVLPDRNMMLYSFTCLKVLGTCLASALNEGRTALPITVFAMSSMEGRGTESQYIWMSLAFHWMGSGKDCVNQTTLVKIHQCKQIPQVEDQWNLKISPSFRSHLGLAWLRNSEIRNYVLLKYSYKHLKANGAYPCACLPT